MKVKELASKMADFGTRPHVNIVNAEHALLYAGKPGDIGVSLGALKVNSFIATGMGCFRINVD